MAVCLECGARKHGALVPCPECHHVARDLEDQARHVLASADLEPMAVEALGAHIEAGGRPADPDPELLAETMALLERATPVRVGLFALLVVAGPLLLIGGTLLGLAWLASMM